MLRAAFDRSRFAEVEQVRHRVEADKRRSRDFARQRQERERKEDLDDKAEAASAALTMAVAVSPPATSAQITAFEAELTTYDTAVVEALMKNDELMTAVQDKLDVLLSHAFVMDDGRRVFRTEDGLQVFDEFGAKVGADEIDPDSIPDHHPTWESFSPLLKEQATLLEQRQSLIEYQSKLDAAREELANGDITEAELEELQTEMIEAMPDGVRAQLPTDHPAAQIEAPTETGQLKTQAALRPTLEGLQGFAPPAMPGT